MMVISSVFSQFRIPNNRLYMALVICYLILPFVLTAQSGMVCDNLSLQSKILKGERKYAIYLPPDYERSERSYPVLYLLHGLGDDQTGWVQFGEVKRIADEAITSGAATPMIIVMPNAKDGRSGYFNWIRKGDWQYEDFFFEELMPHVEKAYRIKGEKQYRAIAGLSMGGGGTFLYAMHHPELFASACPLSSWFWWADFETFKKKLSVEDQKVSEDQLLEFYQHNHPLELVESVSEEDLNSVRWYIDCGDDDFLYEGNSLMHIAMRKHEIKHEFRIRDGGHSWGYWRTALPVVLEFVTDGFHRR